MTDFATEEDQNPDRERIAAPVTKEELAQFRKFVAERRAQLAQRTITPHPSGRTTAQRQVDDWRQIADTSLATLESAQYDLADSWMLELRKSAAEGIAKGYGEFDKASALAPEIGADLARLRLAIERADEEVCLCAPPALTQAEFVFSPKHRRIVALTQCAKCGDWNAK